jgi:hypothetical protein
LHCATLSGKVVNVGAPLRTGLLVLGEACQQVRFQCVSVVVGARGGGGGCLCSLFCPPFGSMSDFPSGCTTVAKKTPTAAAGAAIQQHLVLKP